MTAAEYWDERIETLNRESLAGLQGGRLLWQVTRCYEGSEFYRERLDLAGVAPEQITSARDVRKLPILTLEELAREQRLHPPFGRLTVAPRENWRALHSAPVAGGQHLLALWTEADVANTTSLAARTLWQVGARPGNLILCASPGGQPVPGMAPYYAAARLACLLVPAGDSPTDQHLDLASAASATVLVCTPAFAYSLAEMARQRGAAWSAPGRTLCLLEASPSGDADTGLDAIDSVLGVRALRGFGLVENAPTIAAECAARAGLHWPEDHLLVEVLDPETQEPVPEGEEGVIVFTHLTRQATPLLRFWSGAHARLVMAPCSCGRGFARSPGGPIRS